MKTAEKSNMIALDEESELENTYDQDWSDMYDDVYDDQYE